MNGVAVVVYGPEASGTRYVTGFLEAAATDETTLVRHCSLPYDTRFIPLDELMADLDRNDTRVIITTRRMDALAKSQVAHGHAADEPDAIRQAQRAYAWAVGECQRLMVPFLMTSYEELADERYRTWVADWALDDADHESVRLSTFHDGNEKHL